jgi:uncharacterized glyoxalase superfamily protein PhnB
VKPKKFIRSVPHLPVRNLQETLNYYRDILGFHDEWTFDEKDGGIQRDDMRMLFGENADHVNSVNNPSQRLPLVWFVENIESIYKEFQDRKIKIESPLTEHPYGMKEFAFIDINGYYIRVSEPL